MVFQLRLGVLGRALSFGFQNTTKTLFGIAPLRSRLPISNQLSTKSPLLVSNVCLKQNLCRQFNTLVAKQSSLLDSSSSQWPLFSQPKRTHIKFSLTKGRQKTVKPVLKRFFRLRWGSWIRPMIGRHKKLWKKNWKKRQSLRRHVLCTPGQNTLFEHMVTRFWKRPMYFVDDPYEPYHVRNDVSYKYYTKHRKF